jgi:hypothetical protein
MPGAGTLLGAAVIAALADSNRKGLILLISTFFFGLCLVGLSLNKVYIVGLGLLFLMGYSSLCYCSQRLTNLSFGLPGLAVVCFSDGM